MITVREHQRKEPSKAQDPFSPIIEARRRAYAKRWGVELPEVANSAQETWSMGLGRSIRKDIEPWKELEMLMKEGKRQVANINTMLEHPRSSLASIIEELGNLAKLMRNIGR